jgi:hypothetical protein
LGVVALEGYLALQQQMERLLLLLLWFQQLVAAAAEIPLEVIVQIVVVVVVVAVLVKAALQEQRGKETQVEVAIVENHLFILAAAVAGRLVQEETGQVEVVAVVEAAELLVQLLEVL